MQIVTALPCKGLYCLRHVTGSFKNAVQSWILQIEPSPSLLLGSRVELHPLAHAQSASLNCVQRLSPKKGASDKNSHPGEGVFFFWTHFRLRLSTETRTTHAQFS